MTQENIILILIAVPTVIGAVIAIVNNEKVNGWVDSVDSWIKGRKEKAQSDNSKASYVTYPLLWLAEHSGGRKFEHRGLKSAILVFQWFMLLYAVGFLLYVLTMIVIAILMVAAVVLLCYFLLKGVAGHNKEKDEQKARIPEVRRKMQDGRSEQRTNLLGHEFVQYYDKQGNEVASSKVHADLLGNKYMQYYDKHGNEMGTSDLKSEFFGGQYIQSYDEQGNEIGTSEERERFLSRNRYTEHKDNAGKVTGTSEKREDIFGKGYTQHSSDNGS
jgi:hypothetical protein